MSLRYPKPGDRVNVIQKKHYETGELTTGVVREVLTKKRFHPRGHKVRLESGIIGRVQSFVDLSRPDRSRRVGAGEVGVQKSLEELPAREYRDEDLPAPDDLR